LLNKGNRLKLLEVRRPDEVGHINYPNYCLFHKRIHHPTSRCFVLKDNIQALIEVGVLTLKSEQKKVTANMVTLNFENFSKLIVYDGLTPIPKGYMEVINSLVEKQEAKGLIPLKIKFRKIIWVHADMYQTGVIGFELAQAQRQTPQCHLHSTG